MQLHYVTSESEALWCRGSDSLQQIWGPDRASCVLSQLSLGDERNSSAKSWWWWYDARFNDLRIWKLVIQPRRCLIFLAKAIKKQRETVQKGRRYIDLWYQLVFAKFPIRRKGVSCLKQPNPDKFHQPITRILYYQTNQPTNRNRSSFSAAVQHRIHTPYEINQTGWIFWCIRQPVFSVSGNLGVSHVM